MSLPRILVVVTLVLFGSILVAAYFKKAKDETQIRPDEGQKVIEIPIKEAEKLEENPVLEPLFDSNDREEVKLPDANRIEMLFNKGEPKLPIVETVSYSPRVPWLKDRAAWIADYASHYKTSRHFIARSLNGKSDYLKQDVSAGKRFNVYSLDKEIEFYLLVDLSRAKLFLYYIDKGSEERVLLKTYDVGLGRPDQNSPSGLLTPLGLYTLGEKVAIYKPKVKGIFNGERKELITVFGTRWIPFDQEVKRCSAPAAGFGIHGVPWSYDDGGNLFEEYESIGKYESDGCIRLKTEDIEEIFAIIITKPSFIEIVRRFEEAEKLGKGVE